MTSARKTISSSDLKLDDLTTVRLLGKGKSGYSYLAEWRHKQVVLKIMHNEEVSYYTFAKPKVELELSSYHVLENAGIQIPEIIGYSLKEQFIVKEYIPGTVVSEMLKEQQIPDNLLFEMLRWEERLSARQINIDYFPSNFVVSGQKVYYVDYEHNPYSDEYNFRNWGIYYWLNQQGFSSFLESGDASYINQPGTGKPLVTDLLENMKNNIIETFESNERNY